MGAFAVPLMIAGGVMGAMGQYQQGREQESALKQQARLAQRNALAAETQARTARQQAGREEETLRKQARQQIGQQSAAIGQSGIGYGGTAGLLQEDSAVQAELDALNIRYGGELEAGSLLDQAKMQRYESKVLKQNAKQAKRAGIMGAATSLLSMGSNLYSGGAMGGGAGAGAGAGLMTKGRK